MNYSQDNDQLEQEQIKKRKRQYKLVTKALIIEKEVSVIMKEIEKLDLGSSSDMINLRKAIVRELTKLKQDEEGA